MSEVRSEGSLAMTIPSPAHGRGFGAVLRMTLAVASMTAAGRNPPWLTWCSVCRGATACTAPRMATTQSAARTAARNTAVITTSAPTKRMAPISVVSTTAAVPKMPDPLTDRPLPADCQGIPGPMSRILLFAVIAGAARQR